MTEIELPLRSEPLMAELAGRRACLAEEMRTIDYLISIIQREDRKQLSGRVTLSASLISATVCAAYGLTKDELNSPRRQARLVRPRHIAMWLCTKLTPLSLPQIGRHFGGRDHTTVLNAMRKAPSFDGHDGELRDNLLNALTHHFNVQPSGQGLPATQLSDRERQALAILKEIRDTQEAAHE